MDAETLAAAARHYDAMKRAQKKYYQKVRESRLAKYREAHPNPRPVGRPKKVGAEGGAENDLQK